MKQAKNRRENALSAVYTVTGTFLACVTAVFALFAFCFRLAEVDGNSMEPNLHSGETVFVLQVPGMPDYGQIVAIGSPRTGRSMVKRVLARGGDTVDVNFETHLLTVNGRVIPETYRVLGAITVQGDAVFPLTVPEGSVFVLGDNRNDSLDSRFTEIGCIRQEELLGRVVCRLFPYGTIE